MFVIERFKLLQPTIDELNQMIPEFGYGGFGELVFYRTYSRAKSDGSMESWNDVVIRVTEGTFSIRKDHYKKNNIPWNEDFWQVYSKNFATSMFKMEWLPPGRGLWAMGSDFVYNRGSMPLQNCAVIEIKNIAKDCHWVMDALMNGVGVGFLPKRDDNLVLHYPAGTYDFIISDDREGWCDSVAAIIECYFNGGPKPRFKYHLVRKAGEPIRGFGGVASGPEPLKDLHERIDDFCQNYLYDDTYDSVRLKMDIVNSIGVCVVAGNVRRSAELAGAPFSDPIFSELKDYERFPERAAIGWMSNNSNLLFEDSDFENLGVIAERVVNHQDLGIINMRNLPKGRLGKNDALRVDHPVLLNPCGETQLESYECCTQADTVPERCNTIHDWYKANEYATVYASTVTLLQSHRPETNAVMLKNRRITVGIMGVSGWKLRDGVYSVIKQMREGYNIVVKTNEWLNDEAGVPRAIRHTCIKPGGTTSKLVGVTPGIGYPTFIETLRRIRVAKNSPIHPLLVEANIPFEEDIFDKYTDIFEYPIIQGPAKPATQAGLWEQAMNLVLVQREWANNAVSNTLYFKPRWKLLKSDVSSDWKCWNNQKVENNKLYEYDPNHEENEIEPVLSMIAPVTKSVSLLPHTADGVYPQSPETGLTREEYLDRKSKIKKIDWSKLKSNVPDVEDDKFCSGGSCQVLQVRVN